ncbi:MAG: class I SAM-dependent methyltransferase [Paracoccaceae bacterium]
MQTQAVFWDKIARKYAAKPVDDVPAYEQTLGRTRAHLQAADRVLEVGCGTGTTALKLAGLVGHLTATDISPEMISIANEKLTDGPDNVTFKVGTLDDPAPAEPYDTVLAFNFLHLLEDVPGALSVIHSQLKPGGMFISKTGCISEANWFLRRILIPVMQKIGKAPYVSGLSIVDVDRLIEEAGFDIVETDTFGGMAPTRMVIARRM